MGEAVFWGTLGTLIIDFEYTKLLKNLRTPRSAFKKSQIPLHLRYQVTFTFTFGLRFEITLTFTFKFT